MAEHELNKIVDDSGEVFNLRDSTKQPTADRVTSWSSTTSDTKYPSEKLVKDSLDGKSNTGHTHSNIVTEGDNRNVSTTPNDYSNKFAFRGLKAKSAIGNPSSATYSYLLGLRGWLNETGGKAHELAFNDNGIFTRKGSTTSWEAWEKLATSKDLDADYRTKDQDISKGVNLVVNGSGTMKSNYNFSTCDYVANTDLPAGVAGCFHKAGLTFFNNEIIAVNTSKTYQLESWYRVKTASTSTVRLSMCCLDIDGKEIQANTICYGVGTLTRLTQDLKDGDTVVHLEDLSGARWIATEAYQRGFIFWNYKNSLGYQYPPETYSRNCYSTLYENANVNVSAGTITLNSAWNKGTIPAGTYVSRYGSGNTYYYVAYSASSAAQTTWTKLSGIARGFPSPGEAGGGAFRPGTAYIKVGWVNANTNGNEWIEFGGIELREIPETISGVLPIANGGTGATTAIGAEYNILNQVADIDTTVNGDRKIALCNQTKSASNGVFRWLKLSNVWTWIKGLLSSESGVNISGSSASCTGNAATATALSAGADRTKLDGIAAGAEVNVQSDWNQTTTTADDYIKNKPAIPSGTELVYDCGTGGTSTTDFDNALAAFNAGRWVIIHTNSSIYYCVGTYDNGLRFRQLTNETDTMKVSTVTWTRGNPLVRTQLEASLSGHTHSQYLTASDITGKMNTSGDNATAPSGSGGDGATATLLNNLTGPNNLDDITSDNVCIPTTNNDGTDQTKWYKRPLSKLWPWIISHTKTRILKASDDVYWGVGADSTHAIDLDYDGSASSPTMGLWVRWGSGSSNAKYMAECDASGNCKFNGNASSATTISGSQVMLPSHSSDGYIGVEQSGKAKAYLEAYDSKGGVWVNNGNGKSDWIAYRDSDGSVHFGADSSSGYRGVAGDGSVKNLFNGAELCGNSYMNSGTSHYRFYFGKMTPGTDNGAKNFCGLIEVNNISTTSGAVRGTGFVAIVKIDARNYDEFFVSMSIINNNGWNLTGLRPTLIVTESGDDRQFGIGFTNASGTLQAFQYTRFNVTGIGYSNGFTYYRQFSATSAKSSSDYFWPAKLGDAENADTVDGYHFAMGTYGGVANTIYFG